MDKQICVFGQYESASSIIFLQKAASHFYEQGYKVYWPLLTQCMYLQDYIVSPARFIEIEEGPLPFTADIEFDFQNAPDFYPEFRKMEAKYKLIDLDFSDWQKYFEFQRNPVREQELFDKLELEGKKYTLVNRNFGTPPDINKKDVYTEGKNLIVEVDFIEGFSAFDWGKVFEEADQISIVESSFAFIAEKWETKATKMFLTPLGPDASQVDYLFKNNWQYKF